MDRHLDSFQLPFGLFLGHLAQILQRNGFRKPAGDQFLAIDLSELCKTKVGCSWLFKTFRFVATAFSA